jgi:CO dehydrogenase nickel-insertion accessory protein CooC1
LVGESDVVVAVCDPSPHGLARLLSWLVEAIALAPSAAVLVIVNRAPAARFRRGELFDEITNSLPAVKVAFVPPDNRVGDAAWNGATVGRGSFTRAVDDVAQQVAGLPRRSIEGMPLEAAS